jgi:hypothetical protein
VAHACNPSYSGDRDQEDCVSELGQANSSQDPISKKAITNKRAGGVVGTLSSNPSATKNKEKKV